MTQRRRDERGFALMTVLAVIAVTAVVLGALLGLMLLTIKITGNHQKIERERRAADGAIVATLNHLRLGDPGAGCGDVPDALPGYGLDFDLPSGSDSVEVTCSAGADEYGDAAGEVKIVGDRYSGTLGDWRDAWPWASAPGGVLAALGASGVEPSLVHTGPEPLRFNGHVNAFAGAAALRDPSDGTPAVEVRGQYRQGVAGFGASGTDCGFLGEVGSPVFIDAVAGLSCGDPAALSQANPADYAIDPTIPVLPAAAAGGCPAGPVVTFAPGRYDRGAVATLNDWFDGSCGNRTFHFPSGIYWFDAADPTRSVEAERNALVMDDPTSSFVFGEPNGWSTSTGATASDFPAACRAGVSTTSPGGSIVLSGRTSLLHRGGRLAVCPYVSPEGQAYPAILQQRTIPTTILVSAGAQKDFTPAANLVSGDATNPTDPVAMRCTVKFLEKKCSSKRNFEVGLSTNGGTSPLSSLRLAVVGHEPNEPVSAVQRRSTTFKVQAPGKPACTTSDQDGAPINGVETEFELLSGSCATAGFVEADLDGAIVTATMTYRYEIVTCLSASGCPPTSQKVVIWDVKGVADTWTGSTTSVDAASSTSWRNVENALVDDATADVRISMPCGETGCWGSPSDVAAEKAFTLEGVGLDDSLNHDDRLNTLGVVVKQKGSQAIVLDIWLFGVHIEVGNLVLDGTTRVTATLADGRECTKVFPGIINRVGSTYYPLMDAGSSLCGSLQLGPDENAAALLDGASITFGIKLDCYGADYGLCGFVRPIPIQYVGLMATTDSYKGPVTQSALTVDSTTAGSGSSANFFGAAHMPRSALDLLWKGRSSGSAIFGGELQVDSLGSHMSSDAEADVVCCTRPDVTAQEVRLTAHVAGRPILSVVAVLAADRSAPEILEWSRCGRDGACEVG